MVHGHVLLLEVDEEPRRQTVAHDLPVVAHPVGVVAQLYLSSERTEHHGLHVSHGEAVTSQVAQILGGEGGQFSVKSWETFSFYLVVKQLFLHRVSQVDVVIHKQMFLEEEHVMSGLPKM